MFIEQAYLIRKQKLDPLNMSVFSSLLLVQRKIKEWYINQSMKIQTQSRKAEFQSNEQSRIYHHELHKKYIKKSSILKLETQEEGIIEGHKKVSAYLEGKVRDLLEHPANLDVSAQITLLSEVEEVITKEDNDYTDQLSWEMT